MHCLPLLRFEQFIVGRIAEELADICFRLQTFYQSRSCIPQQSIASRSSGAIFSHLLLLSALEASIAYVFRLVKLFSVTMCLFSSAFE